MAICRATDAQLGSALGPSNLPRIPCEKKAVKAGLCPQHLAQWKAWKKWRAENMTVRKAK